MRCRRKFVRNAVLHEEFFKYPRLMIPAIQNGVILVLGLVHKVMGNQFAGNALSFMLFIVCA